MKEEINLVGIFNVYKVRNGIKELCFNERNLITNSAKRYLLTALFLPNVVSDPIKTIKVGVGGSVDPEGLFPKLEDPDMSDLNSTILELAVNYDDSLDEIAVTFYADIDQSQGNGNLFSEAGLFTNSKQMFNIKNFPGIPKTSEFSLHFEWTIQYL